MEEENKSTLEIQQNELTIEEYKYLAELVYSQPWDSSTKIEQNIFRKLGHIVYENGGKFE